MKNIFTFLSLMISIGFTQNSKSHLLVSPHNLTGDSTSTDLNVCRSCHVTDGPGFSDISTINQACLSCHDGSVSKGFPKDGSVGKIPSISTFYHSFQTNTHTNLELAHEDEMIHCATCHDPHDNSNGNFLKMPTDELCISCHEKERLDASLHGHSISNIKNVNGTIECSSCHNIHLISSNQPLLSDNENTLCLSCHDGTLDNQSEIPSLNDIRVPLDKLYSHLGMEQFNPNGSMNEVTCSDCHNPHLVQENENSLLDGALHGVSGISNVGTSIDIATHEYEICYKCHSTNTQSPFSINIAEKVSTLNKSFHPIEGLSTNLNAKKSLIDAYSSIGLMTCSDCHGNDDAFGVQGIHGSNHEGLLVDTYSTNPFTQENTQSDNELCFSCHDYNYVVESGGFRWHKLHIETAQYNCNSCHDPHGSPLYESLVDLNKPYIQPTHGGDLNYTSNGDGSGSCSLSCHGHIHQKQPF